MAIGFSKTISLGFNKGKGAIYNSYTIKYDGRLIYRRKSAVKGLALLPPWHF